MRICSIKTPIFKPESVHEDVVDAVLNHIEDRSIIAISTKIVSLIEGRVIPFDEVEKPELIKKESDMTLSLNDVYLGVYHTIKDNLLIASAGIDESNAANGYILYPVDPLASAIKIWSLIRKETSHKNIGVILTDSQTRMMRRGVTGFALAFAGFKPFYSYVGAPDLNGRALAHTEVNIVDALATSAVYMMGEGAEQTPIAVITDAPKIEFSDTPPTLEEFSKTRIPMEQDLYRDILMSAPWVENNG